MKNAILRILFAVAVGTTLIAWPENAAKYLVLTLGTMFVAPSAVSLLIYLFSPNGKRIFPFGSIGSLAFGLWMIMQPEFFTTVIMYVLGAILIFGGLQQVLLLIVARSWKPVSLAFYLAPLLTLAAGVLIVWQPDEIRDITLYIIGIFCFVYAVEELIYAIGILRLKPKKKPEIQEENIEDAVIIDDDEQDD